MAFGKTFLTLKEAREHVKKKKDKGYDVQIRKLSKKLFPKTKKRYHVGTYLDWLNY